MLDMEIKDIKKLPKDKVVREYMENIDEKKKTKKISKAKTLNTGYLYPTEKGMAYIKATHTLKDVPVYIRNMREVLTFTLDWDVVINKKDPYISIYEKFVKKYKDQYTDKYLGLSVEDLVALGSTGLLQVRSLKQDKKTV